MWKNGGVKAKKCKRRGSETETGCSSFSFGLVPKERSVHKMNFSYNDDIQIHLFYWGICATTTAAATENVA